MDEMTQMLLSQLAAGNGPPAGFSVADLVEQQLGDNPMAAPIVAGLRQREAAAADAEDPEPAVELDPTELDPEVADVLERLYAEVAERRERQRLLADALGACERCFGEDEACPVCRGRGRPGGRRPDPVLFEELVKPALRRVEDLPAALSTQVE
ncbi:MAG TPA: hypothetical protein VFN92_12135 [Solirubrobacterales bacterium]|nr:hypothetical protein [Solirubrobacterales bacterium]